MTSKSAFDQATEKHFKMLEMYVPVVARVHGPSHPEFHDVRAEYDSLVAKLNTSGAELPALDDEFGKIRQITNGYTIPEGVCESYEAVYNMLAEVDAAYHA